MSTPVGDVTKVLAAATTSTKRDPVSRNLPLAPPKTADAPPAKIAEPDGAALQRAVEELNRHFAAQRTDLKFSVEKDLGVVVVAVVDAQDGTVLRQMPSAEALHIARVIRDARSNLIEAVA
jgi:flagellar protein FlaG